MNVGANKFARETTHHQKPVTPLKIEMCPENQWLEDVFSY